MGEIYFSFAVSSAWAPSMCSSESTGAMDWTGDRAERDGSLLVADSTWFGALLMLAAVCLIFSRLRGCVLLREFNGNANICSEALCRCRFLQFRCSGTDPHIQAAARKSQGEVSGQSGDKNFSLTHSFCLQNESGSL